MNANCISRPCFCYLYLAKRGLPRVAGSPSSAGENEKVSQAVGRKLISGRGIRVLSMDGGGMKVQLILYIYY